MIDLNSLQEQPEESINYDVVSLNLRNATNSVYERKNEVFPTTINNNLYIFDHSILGYNNDSIITIPEINFKHPVKKTYTTIYNRPNNPSLNITQNTNKKNNKKRSISMRIQQPDRKVLTYNCRTKLELGSHSICSSSYKDTDNSPIYLPKLDRRYLIEKKLQTRSMKKLGFNKKVKVYTVDCTICCGTLVDPAIFDCCNTKYCKDCIKSYFTEGLKDFYIKIRNNIDSNTAMGGSIFICPEKKCRQKISNNFVESILSGPDLEKFKKANEMSNIALIPNNVFCPIPDCDSYSLLNSKDGKKLICIKNKHEFCHECLKNYHEDTACKVEIIVEEKYALDNKMKQCPGCKIYIQKNNGCNHMTCLTITCRHEFCWICLEPYTSKHYSNPLTRCYQMNNDEVINPYLRSPFVIFLKLCLRILAIFIAIILALSLFTLVLLSACSVWFMKEAYKFEISCNTRFRTNLYKITFFFTNLVMGIAYYNLGLIIIAIILATSPGWLLVILCLYLLSGARNIARQRAVRLRNLEPEETRRPLQQPRIGRLNIYNNSDASIEQISERSSHYEPETAAVPIDPIDHISLHKASNASFSSPGVSKKLRNKYESIPLIIRKHDISFR